MIVREDGTFEINLRYPNSNWTDETEGIYVVDETTPEGQALAEKIMMLFPYFDLVIEDGELVDVVENPDLKQEWEEEQEFLEDDDEMERISLEELGLDQVDNTRDLDKPISIATQEALDGKVDKVEGKGLSTRDFLPEYEEKLIGIEPGANRYIHPETHPVEMIEGLATVAISGDYNDLINKPDLEDIGGDIELPPDLIEDVLALQDEVVRLENEKVDKEAGKGLSTRDFLPEHEQKLAGIEPGANKYEHPETHPVEMIEGLASVAITGDYEDLINKPDLENIGGGGYNFLIGTEEPSLEILEEGMMYFQVEGEGFIEKVSPTRVTISPEEPVIEHLEEGELYFYYQV